MNRYSTKEDQPVHYCLALGAIALAALLSACSTTQAAKPELTKGRCAFLAPDVCSMLTPGTGEEGALRYVAPNVQWSQYTKVMVSPVTFWGGAKQEVLPKTDKSSPTSCTRPW